MGANMCMAAPASMSMAPVRNRKFCQLFNSFMGHTVLGKRIGIVGIFWMDFPYDKHVFLGTLHEILLTCQLLQLSRFLVQTFYHAAGSLEA